MKYEYKTMMKKLIPVLLLLPLVAWLNGCAAGAATAGTRGFQPIKFPAQPAVGTKLVLPKVETHELYKRPSAPKPKQP